MTTYETQTLTDAIVKISDGMLVLSLGSDAIRKIAVPTQMTELQSRRFNRSVTVTKVSFRRGIRWSTLIAMVFFSCVAGSTSTSLLLMFNVAIQQSCVGLLWA
jgi:hypothetical protein